MKLKEELLRGIYCYGNTFPTQDSINLPQCSREPSSPSFLDAM